MQTWPENVNKKAYGLEISFGKNYTEVSFEAGTKRRILNDLKARKKYSFKIDMDDEPGDSSSEYKQFVKWFEETLHCGAESIAFTDFEDLDSEKEYYFSDTPSASGQGHKEVSISLEEA